MYRSCLVNYGETRTAVIFLCGIMYVPEKGFAVGWSPSLALETLEFTPVNFLDAAWHHGETGSFCLSYLAASTLGHPMPDSAQVSEVIKHIRETSSLPKS